MFSKLARKRSPSPPATSSKAPKMRIEQKLIITMGDMSDADGFMALAAYAKTGADCLYIINYPAYIGMAGGQPNFATENPGKGFHFSADEWLASVVKKGEAFKAGFSEFEQAQYEIDNLAMINTLSVIGKYEGTTARKVKYAHTHMAFSFAKKIWYEAGATGDLYFAIGGINSVQPFGINAVKNEIATYYDTFNRLTAYTTDKAYLELGVSQNYVYNTRGDECDDWSVSHYTKIAMDFNGSAAWWNSYWMNQFNHVEKEHFLGLYVMGGVYTDQPALTIGSIPNVLNRFSCATMNQLYDPEKAAALLAYIQHDSRRWQIFTVSNNVVKGVNSSMAVPGQFEYPEGSLIQQWGNAVPMCRGGQWSWSRGYLDEVFRMLEINGIDNSDLLFDICENYYTYPIPPAAKPFDLYTAKGVVKAIQTEEVVRIESSEDEFVPWTAPQWYPRQFDKMFLFVHNTTGATFISRRREGADAAKEYYEQTYTDQKKTADMKKEEETFFAAEGHYVEVEVVDIRPEMDPISFKIGGI